MASRTRDSIYKNEKLFLRILDERTAGLFLDADTEIQSYVLSLLEGLSLLRGLSLLHVTGPKK